MSEQRVQVEHYNPLQQQEQFPARLPPAATVYQAEGVGVAVPAGMDVSLQSADIPVNLEQKPLVLTTPPYGAAGGGGTPGAAKDIKGKGLVIDDSVKLTPGATVQVYRCPIVACNKPCVTLRAFKMHAKCVHKTCDQDSLQPIMEDTEAHYICKVHSKGRFGW